MTDPKYGGVGHTEGLEFHYPPFSAGTNGVQLDDGDHGFFVFGKDGKSIYVGHKDSSDKAAYSTEFAIDKTVSRVENVFEYEFGGATSTITIKEGEIEGSDELKTETSSLILNGTEPQLNLGGFQIKTYLDSDNNAKTSLKTADGLEIDLDDEIVGDVERNSVSFIKKDVFDPTDDDTHKYTKTVTVDNDGIKVKFERLFKKSLVTDSDEQNMFFNKHSIGIPTLYVDSINNVKFDNVMIDGKNSMRIGKTLYHTEDNIAKRTRNDYDKQSSVILRDDAGSALNEVSNIINIGNELIAYVRSGGIFINEYSGGDERQFVSTSYTINDMSYNRNTGSILYSCSNSGIRRIYSKDLNNNDVTNLGKLIYRNDNVNIESIEYLGEGKFLMVVGAELKIRKVQDKSNEGGTIVGTRNDVSWVKIQNEHAYVKATGESGGLVRYTIDDILTDSSDVTPEPISGMGAALASSKRFFVTPKDDEGESLFVYIDGKENSTPKLRKLKEDGNWVMDAQNTEEVYQSEINNTAASNVTYIKDNTYIMRYDNSACVKVCKIYKVDEKVYIEFGDDYIGLYGSTKIGNTTFKEDSIKDGASTIDIILERVTQNRDSSFELWDDNSGNDPTDFSVKFEPEKITYKTWDDGSIDEEKVIKFSKLVQNGDEKLRVEKVETTTSPTTHHKHTTNYKSDSITYVHMTADDEAFEDNPATATNKTITLKHIAQNYDSTFVLGNKTLDDNDINATYKNDKIVVREKMGGNDVGDKSIELKKIIQIGDEASLKTLNLTENANDAALTLTETAYIQIGSTVIGNNSITSSDGTERDYDQLMQNGDSVITVGDNILFGGTNSTFTVQIEDLIQNGDDFAQLGDMYFSAKGISLGGYSGGSSGGTSGDITLDIDTGKTAVNTVEIYHASVLHDGDESVLTAFNGDGTYKNHFVFIRNTDGNEYYKAYKLPRELWHDNLICIPGYQYRLTTQDDANNGQDINAANHILIYDSTLNRVAYIEETADDVHVIDLENVILFTFSVNAIDMELYTHDGDNWVMGNSRNFNISFGTNLTPEKAIVNNITPNEYDDFDEIMFCANNNIYHLRTSRSGNNTIKAHDNDSFLPNQIHYIQTDQQLLINNPHVNMDGVMWTKDGSVESYTDNEGIPENPQNTFLFSDNGVRSILYNSTTGIRVVGVDDNGNVFEGTSTGVNARLSFDITPIGGLYREPYSATAEVLSSFSYTPPSEGTTTSSPGSQIFWLDDEGANALSKFQVGPVAYKETGIYYDQNRIVDFLRLVNEGDNPRFTGISIGNENEPLTTITHDRIVVDSNPVDEDNPLADITISKLFSNGHEKITVGTGDEAVSFDGVRFVRDHLETSGDKWATYSNTLSRSHGNAGYVYVTALKSFATRTSINPTWAVGDITIYWGGNDINDIFYAPHSKYLLGRDTSGDFHAKPLDGLEDSEKVYPIPNLNFSTSSLPTKDIVMLNYVAGSTEIATFEDKNLHHFTITETIDSGVPTFATASKTLNVGANVERIIPHGKYLTVLYGNDSKRIYDTSTEDWSGDVSSRITGVSHAVYANVKNGVRQYVFNAENDLYIGDMDQNNYKVIETSPGNVDNLAYVNDIIYYSVNSTQYARYRSIVAVPMSLDDRGITLNYYAKIGGTYYESEKIKTKERTLELNSIIQNGDNKIILRGNEYVGGDIARIGSNNQFTTDQTIDGSLRVTKNIIQGGAVYTKDISVIKTENEFIKLRKGAADVNTGPIPLTVNEYAGLYVESYKLDNGAAVHGGMAMDGTGMMRVGKFKIDIENEAHYLRNDGAKIVLVRDEDTEMSAGGLLYYDENSKIAKTNDTILTHAMDVGDAGMLNEDKNYTKIAGYFRTNMLEISDTSSLGDEKSKNEVLKHLYENFDQSNDFIRMANDNVQSVDEMINSYLGDEASVLGDFKGVTLYNEGIAAFDGKTYHRDGLVSNSIKRHVNRNGTETTVTVQSDNGLNIKDDDGIAWTNIYCKGYVSSSMAEYKDKIVPYEDSACDLIKGSKIYEYEFKSTPGVKKVGFVIDPTGEHKSPDPIFVGENQRGIDGYTHSSVNTKAIQELIKENEELKERLSKLERLVQQIL